MIRSFRDKQTQALFLGNCPRKWLAIREVAERKLMQLHAAASLDFLRVPPAIAWKHSRETGATSGVSALMIAGEFVLYGMPAMRWMWKLSIITRGVIHDS